MDIRTLNRIEDKLYAIYGKGKGARISEGIQKLVSEYKLDGQPKEWVDEKDVMLITYGDSIKSAEAMPLDTLKEFLNEYVGNTMKDVIGKQHMELRKLFCSSTRISRYG